MSNANNSEKIIWAIFIAVAVFELINIAGDCLGVDLFKNPVIIFLKYALPLAALVPHALAVLGKTKGGFFLLLSFFIGLAFEIIGVKYGVIFGGHYSYRPSALMIGGVPLLIPICWMVFIYTGYSVVNLLLYFSGGNKPDKYNKNILLLLGLIALDGLAVLSIDLFLEPVQVAEGYWIWAGSGRYFNVPAGNFIGWFIVAAAASGIFRIAEYFFPARAKANIKLLLISFIGYCFIYLSTLIYSIKNEFFDLIFIGGSAMLFFIFINAFLLMKQKAGLLQNR